jgi:hypothetical protein
MVENIDGRTTNISDCEIDGVVSLGSLRIVVVAIITKVLYIQMENMLYVKIRPLICIY